MGSQASQDQREISWPEGRPDDSKKRFLQRLREVRNLSPDPRDFRHVKILGSGGFGLVALRTDSKGKRYAVKEIRLEKLSPREYSFIQREIDFLALLSLYHDCFPNIYGKRETEETLYIFMEYLEGNDLIGYFETLNTLPELKEALSFFYQTVLCVQVLHRLGIAHRDLKPANLIVTPQKEVRIVDFGFTCLVEQRAQQILSEIPYLEKNHGCRSQTVAVGTRGYIAPEILRGQSHPLASDIYALGFIGLYLLTGRNPSEIDQHRVVLPQRLTRAENETQSRFFDLLGEMIRYRPKQRPTIDQVAVRMEELLSGRRSPRQPSARLDLPQIEK